MDPEVLNFAEVATIIVGLVGGLCLIGVVTWRMTISGRRAPLDTELRDRIEGLQQSVDTIAIEVERIAEAQRFSARLLSERAEQQPLPR